jgi:hypothetical protein
MTVASLVMVLLMAFVLLAPTLMVAVLVSGLARREPHASDEPRPHLGGLLVPDRVAMAIEQDQH